MLVGPLPIDEFVDRVMELARSGYQRDGGVVALPRDEKGAQTAAGNFVIGSERQLAELKEFRDGFREGNKSHVRVELGEEPDFQKLVTKEDGLPPDIFSE